MWSFLKPMLHGKVLYTPNTPEINKVIQKVGSVHRICWATPAVQWEDDFRKTGRDHYVGWVP